MEGITLEQSGFDREKSPLKEVYEMVNARTPFELYQRYLDTDQELMRAGAWDYGDNNLLVNKMKHAVESIGIASLPEQYREKEWAQVILWLWYHHAISCALFRYKDKEAAKYYSEKALEYQGIDHPNKITRLLYFLAHDKIEEASAWADKIDSEPEKSTAVDLLNWYKGEIDDR